MESKKTSGVKTAEQIMQEVANENSYADWGEAMYDAHEHTQIEYTAEVANRYAAQFAPKWIPVSERLPENMEHVIVMSSTGIASAIYQKSNNHFVGRNQVTHWMPLPINPTSS